MRTESLRSVIAVALLSAAPLLGGCAASGAHQGAQEMIQPPTPTNSATPKLEVGDGKCVPPACVGSDEFYKISATIKNTSDMTLILTTAQAAHDNGDDGGHWDDRLQTSLAPGATDNFEVYSAVGGQGLNLVYHAKENNAKVKLVASDPARGSNNTNDTHADDPLTVTPQISSGRQTTVIFTIGGRW